MSTSQNDHNKSSSNKKGPLLGPFYLSAHEVRPHLLNPKLSEKDFCHAISQMSLAFTQNRHEIKTYTGNVDKISAYTLFYLPTNIPKLYFLLSKLSDDLLDDLRIRSFIDMGAGPGTYSLAFQMMLEPNLQTPIVGIDQSSHMLEQYQKILKGFYPDKNISMAKNLFELSAQQREQLKEGILFFGHSINEMGVEAALKMIEFIGPAYIIWIEPGTSEQFVTLKSLRTTLLSSNYDIIYPCPSGDECPSQWCHQVLRISHHPEIERLSQLVFLDRGVLPLFSAVFKRQVISPGKKCDKKFTITRFLGESKAFFNYEVCGFLSDGPEKLNLVNRNQIVKIEIPKRHLSKDKIQEIRNFNVGDKLELVVEKKFPTFWRVSIK